MVCPGGVAADCKGCLVEDESLRHCMSKKSRAINKPVEMSIKVIGEAVMNWPVRQNRAHRGGKLGLK